MWLRHHRHLLFLFKLDANIHLLFVVQCCSEGPFIYHHVGILLKKGKNSCLRGFGAMSAFERLGFQITALVSKLYFLRLQILVLNASLISNLLNRPSISLRVVQMCGCVCASGRRGGDQAHPGLSERTHRRPHPDPMPGRQVCVRLL